MTQPSLFILFTLVASSSAVTPENCFDDHTCPRNSKNVDADGTTRTLCPVKTYNTWRSYPTCTDDLCCSRVRSPTSPTSESPTSEPTPGVTRLPTVWDPVFPPSPTSEPTPGVTGLPTVWDPVFPPSPTAEPTPGVTGLPTVWDPVFPSPLNCYDDHTCPLNTRNVDADGSTRTPCNWSQLSPCTDAKCCTVVQLPVCVHEDCEHWDCPMWCACFDESKADVYTANDCDDDDGECDCSDETPTPPDVTPTPPFVEPPMQLW